MVLDHTLNVDNYLTTRFEAIYQRISVELKKLFTIIVVN